MSTPGPTDVRPVGRGSLVWRVLATLALVALLVDGSLRMSDDVWPFSPMSQYADSKPADDTVVITRVYGRLADGSRVELPLRVGESGIRRADVEARISDIQRDPSLLRAVGEGWTARHPGEPALQELFLVQDRTFLEKGRTVGGDQVGLATWTVPGG